GQGWRFAAFGEDRIRLGDHTTLGLGTRLTFLPQHRRVFAEPRLELRHDRTEHALGAWSARLAGGLYRQFVGQYNVSSVSPSALLPAIRFWLPVDSTVAPPKAYHAAGSLLLMPSARWTFRAETYYKYQQHLLVIDYPALWSDAAVQTVQSGFLRQGRGHAYGASTSAERTTERLRLHLRYEFSRALRQYAFQDSLRLIAAPWNEPHRVELDVDWAPHARVIATARWRGGWGRTWGFRRAYYDYFGNDPTQAARFDPDPTNDDRDEVIDFQDPTAHALPAFAQLDLGAAYTHPLGPAALQIRLDVLNALDRANVADRTLRQIEQGAVTLLEPEERTLLARTVSVALRLKW
ncbi:MAG: TonB-dependent receptor, partial [Rhodothermales bacterium]|nr:TonB-dependent receptor [Rhodothermales bacterium]